MSKNKLKFKMSIELSCDSKEELELIKQDLKDLFEHVDIEDDFDFGISLIEEN